VIAWLFLFACGEAPTAPEAQAPPETQSTSPWTVDNALAPTLEVLDTNGDGRVTAMEYRRVQGAAPDFKKMDEDRNGALSLAEFRAMSDRLDPQTWDGNMPRKPVAEEVWRGMFSGEPAVRQLSELMRFVRSEVAAGAPEGSLPTDEQIQAAAETKDLESEAVREIFETLRAARDAEDAP
jgi:hypothetical protein